MLITMAKEDRINLRASAEQKLEGKTISEFMLEASVRRAQDALLEQRVFTLSPEEYDEFAKALATPGSRQRLEKLLAIKTPWE
jgi:uncharacterized protein (DUF1778 family)